MLSELFQFATILYDIFMILYVLTIVGTLIVILSENRNPVKSLAWATVLVLLPMVGIVLYLFFGRSLKNHHMLSRKNWRRLHAADAAHVPHNLPLTPSGSLQTHLMASLDQAAYYEGNDIKIFTSGKSKFDSLMADIKAAKQFVHIQYYIVEDDNLGRELGELLIEKVRQGVKVKLIYDHVGSYTIKKSIFKRLRKAGVEASPFFEITFTKIANRLNWRNHRKLVIIDGQVGYIGGMNVADRYVTGDKKSGPWRDTHLRIAGPAVAAMHNAFATDWYYMRRTLLTLPQESLPQPSATGDAVQIVASGPTDKWNAISFVVLRAITMAKKNLYIQTPYFLPNDPLLRALQVAALSGVDVRLMIPRRTDSTLLRLASSSYLKECLLAGIKVYFYDAAMLHSKVIIVDDDFVTTGSSNFDFRSFEHNFECNALVYSTSFNRRMKDIFIVDQRHSTRLILSHWRRRPLMTKAFESLARLLAPIL